MEIRHVAIPVDKLWDLVNDAYKEGKEQSETVEWDAPFRSSQSYDQVVRWLEWYWQSKNDVGE